MAEAADTDRLMRLINAAFEVERSFKSADRVDMRELKELMRTGRFLVLVDEAGALAGCVYVRVNDEDGERRGYLGLLSVDPARQGLGLGRRLMDAAEAHARERGARVMDLSVVNIRHELPPLYARLGYVESGTAPWPAEKAGHVNTPVHFVVMSKTL